MRQEPFRGDYGLSGPDAPPDAEPVTRWAVVAARSAREVEAYLPDNYRVVDHVAEPNGRVKAVVAGEDVAGWTLDGYVLPRLASGLLIGREYPSHAEAVEAASAAMN